jgi:type II secretory pathway pseudopilin PulG
MHPRRPSPAWTDERAFTLTEVWISVAILLLLMAGWISSSLFGMKFQTIVQTKLSATTNARQTVNNVRGAVQSSYTFYVGNWSNSTFNLIPFGSYQQGNALQVYPTTNTASTAPYYVYYRNSTTSNLVQLTFNNGVETASATIAQYITNQIVFQAQDCYGNVLTNNVANRLLYMGLDFYQWEFPVATAGAGGMYDYYHIQTRAARREGI